MTKLTGLKSFLRKDFIIGLDLGSTSFKLVQLSQRDEGLTLIRAESKEAGSADPLKELLRGVDLKNSKFIVTINCPRTALRVITAPPMPRRELQEAVQLESKNYFPFSIGESLLDFEGVGEVTEKGLKKARTVIATSPRKTVDATLALLKKAGIRSASLIPVSSALQKLGQASETRTIETGCLMDIGDRYTELVILQGRHLIFSRKIPIAGREFTQAMTGVLVSDRGKTQLSLEEAEKVKRELGIPSEGESRMIEDKISSRQVLSMLRAPLEQLVNEIARSFDYYREERRGEKVDSLLLFGRGALLKGLAPALSEALGIEAKLGNPLERLRIDPQLTKPDEGFAPFAVALGAALSAGKGVNLLPPEIKEEMERTLKRATVQSVAAASILLLAFLYIGMRIQLTNFQKRIAVAKLERASLELELEKVAAQSLARQVLAGEPYWEDLFRELSNVIPSEIQLTELGMRKGRLTLKGLIVAREKEQILSNLILNLEKGIFGNVKLITTKEREDQSAREFELECRVD